MSASSRALGFADRHALKGTEERFAHDNERWRCDEGSRLPTETDEIIQLEHVRPGLDILARLGEFGDVSGEELHRLGVTIGAAPIHVIAPLLDFPRRAFVFCVGLNPFEGFAVAFAFLQFREQLLGVDPHEAEKALVQRAVEVILAVCPGERGAALVQTAWQERVAAKAGARAPRRAPREVGRAELFNTRGHGSLARISGSFVWGCVFLT
jgi:hypothetical protein